jgi:hypothetical protein
LSTGSPVIEALLILALQAPQAPPPATPPPPAPETAQADPAVAAFTTGVGLLLVPVKPDHAAAYEAAITALQAALQASTNPEQRAMAAGWRVYRAAETDAKKNVLYVHALAPVVPGADYRPSLLLDDLLKGAPADLLTPYREALAGPPSKLSLTEVANMGVAPVPKGPGR